MKTVIATSNGKIAYDSTAKAPMVKFKKGDEVTLPDFQADFLVKCGKAEPLDKKSKADAEQKAKEEAEAEAEAKADAEADKKNSKK